MPGPENTATATAAAPAPVQSSDPKDQKGLAAAADLKQAPTAAGDVKSDAKAQVLSFDTKDSSNIKAVNDANKLLKDRILNIWNNYSNDVEHLKSNGAIKEGFRHKYENYLEQLEKILAQNKDNSVAIIAHIVIAAIHLRGAPVKAHWDHFAIGGKDEGPTDVLASLAKSNPDQTTKYLRDMRVLYPLTAIDEYVSAVEMKLDTEYKVQFKELIIKELNKIVDYKRLGAKTPGHPSAMAPVLAFYELGRLRSADAKVTIEKIVFKGDFEKLAEAIRFNYGIDKTKDVIKAENLLNDIIQNCSQKAVTSDGLKVGLLAHIIYLELLYNSPSIPTAIKIKACDAAIAFALKLHRSKLVEKHEEDYLLNRLVNLINKNQAQFEDAKAQSEDKTEGDLKAIRSQMLSCLDRGLSTPWTRFFKLALPHLLKEKNITELIICFAEYLMLHRVEYPDFAANGLKLFSELQKLPGKYAHIAPSATMQPNYFPALVELAICCQKGQEQFNPEQVYPFVVVCGCLASAIENLAKETWLPYKKDLYSFYTTLETIQRIGLLPPAHAKELTEIITKFKAKLDFSSAESTTSTHDQKSDISCINISEAFADFDAVQRNIDRLQEIQKKNRDKILIYLANPKLGLDELRWCAGFCYITPEYKEIVDKIRERLGLIDSARDLLRTINERMPTDAAKPAMSASSAPAPSAPAAQLYYGQQAVTTFSASVASNSGVASLPASVAGLASAAAASPPPPVNPQAEGEQPGAVNSLK